MLPSILSFYMTLHKKVIDLLTWSYVGLSLLAERQNVPNLFNWTFRNRCIAFWVHEIIPFSRRVCISNDTFKTVVKLLERPSMAVYHGKLLLCTTVARLLYAVPACLSSCLSVCLFVCFFVCLFVCLVVCLSPCLSVSHSLFETVFEG